MPKNDILFYVEIIILLRVFFHSSETTGANVLIRGATFLIGNFNFMNVHIPSSSCFDMAMANAVTARPRLSAYTTNSAHDIPPEIMTGQLYNEIKTNAIVFIYFLDFTCFFFVTNVNLYTEN